MFESKVRAGVGN